jgi:hypothetical protein
LLRYPDLAADLARRDTSPSAGKSFSLDENLLRDTDQTPAETREQILAKHDELPVAGRDSLCAALACSWARTDPQGAANWAAAHAKPEDPASQANMAAQYVFIRWVNSDPRAALDWWQSLPNSAMRDVIGTEASTRFAEDGDFETALKLFRAIPEKQLSQATEHFALLYAKRDPAAAAQWLAGLPEVVAGERAVEAVTTRYYDRDPEATAHWVETLDPGSMRDLAVKQLIKKSAQLDPSGAAEWVEKIQDPKVRGDASVSVASAWRTTDAEAMRAWVRDQPAMDEKWRAFFLRP